MANPSRLSTESVLTEDEVRRYVKAAGENDFVDAKGPCSWADDDTKAKLAKDIAAFANSDGGGAIVIGKQETDHGTFELKGLSPEECKSFDTTKVGQWVNSYFSPPIRLTSCPTTHESKVVVVISVAEFRETPVICTRDFMRPSGKGNELAKGAIYVRTENAESAPLQTAGQLSTLVSRAVVKRQNELRELLDSVLAGRTARNVPTDEEQFSVQAVHVEQELLRDVKAKNQGAWKFVIHPDTFEARWPSVGDLSGVMQRVSLPHHRFPQEYFQSLPREWGISGGYSAMWALTHEGLLYVWKGYRENHEPWESPYVHEEEKRIEPGRWLDMAATVHTVADLFALSPCFAAEFDNTTQVRFRVEGSHIKGRHLLRRGINLMDFGHPPCLLETFRYSKTLPAGRLVGSWKQLCVHCLQELFSRFPGGQEHSDRVALERWVDKYTDDIA